MAKGSRKTPGAAQFPSSRKKSDMKKGDATEALGGSGTQIVQGFIENDYNAAMSGQLGMLKYEKMRKSDAQVAASLLVCELPIRATTWQIQPARDEENTVDPIDQEIADFVEIALFEKMEGITWDNFLHEVLTCLAFGHSVFEKVYTADDEHVWIEKLASRKQTTIQKWETQDGAPGITQFLPTPVIGGPNDGKSQVSIPAEKLLIFSFAREGDNLEGVSILRSAYKHFYMKDTLYKFDVVKHERQGVGIPVLTMPEQAAPGDEVKATAILQKIRANEQGGIVLPFGWKFEYADVKGTTGSDMWKSIEHHNAMIAKNVLAMFMEIVGGEQGSRALSEDQSDFFLLSLEAVARLLEDVINRYLIPELVDLNFEGVESYPLLTHKAIGNVDYSKIVVALEKAVAAGVLTPDFDTEVWLRALLDLPAKMAPEDVKALQDEEDEIFGPPEQAPEVDENGEPVAPADPEAEPLQATEENRGRKIRAQRSYGVKARNKRVGTRIKQLEGKAAKKKENPATAKRIDKVVDKRSGKGQEYHDLPMYAPSEAYRAYSEIFDNKRILALQNSVEREDRPALRQRGFNFNDFEDKAWRGLTFAERKVNLTSLENALQKADSQLKASMGETTAKMKADLLDQVKRAVDKNDIAAVGKIRAKYTGELASALTEVQKSMFDVGKQGAAAEMGVKAPATRSEVKGVMRVGNDKVVEKLAADMEQAAALSVTQVAAKRGGSITETGVAEAVGAASASLDKVIEQSAELRTLTLSGSLNLGRASMFERFPELIYGFQFSAILDDKTTDTCLSLDGRVVKAGSPDFYTYAPPRHYNCRSIWVEILNDEEFKPEFNDIPNSVPDNATIDVHKEMQTPEVKQNSPAVKVLQAELEDRQTKLDELKESGKFPNRQEAHQKRITEIEKALGKTESEFTSEDVIVDVRAILSADGIRFRSDNGK